MTLDDLTNEMPSEEYLLNYPAIISKESDRSAAIMASALVEQALFVALTSHMANPGEDEQLKWFYGQNAPFKTFDAKIRLGRALAIYDEHLEGRLTTIRKIRNVFAHRSLPLDFSHPALKPLCLLLTPYPDKDAEQPMRHIFAIYCLAVTRTLITDAFRCGGQEKEICLPALP